MSQPHRPHVLEVQPKQTRDPGVAKTQAVLDLVFGPPVERSFDVHLWDGSVQRAAIGSRIQSLGGVAKSIGTVVALPADARLAAAAAYAIV